MAKFDLVRATPANGLFVRLKDEWVSQMAHEDAPTMLYVPMMEHAERISAENPQDPGVDPVRPDTRRVASRL